MFFRRGRLSAKKAQTQLVELFDNRYQWPLRMPIIHMLAHGDPLRFLCSMRFLVDWVGQGVFLLNRNKPPAQAPWFGDGLQGALSKLQRCPTDLYERLTHATVMNDPVSAELEVRRLLLEIIGLSSKEQKHKGQEESWPLVAWLDKIADLEMAAEAKKLAEPNQADLEEIARRAVRIVWRLPGSRLAAVSESAALGHAGLVSDVDISLLGSGLPDPDVRRSLITATAGAADDITQLTAKSHAVDVFWLRDRSPDGDLHQVNVRYFLIDEALRLIENPVPESRADWELLSCLSTAEFLVDYELRGPDLLRDLQRATLLARPERMAKAAADLDQALTRLKASVDDGPRSFYVTTDAILALFQLLAARNDRWLVCPKCTAVWFESLEHVPVDAHQRISAVALLPFRAEHTPSRLQTLTKLAQEALNI